MMDGTILKQYTIKVDGAVFYKTVLSIPNIHIHQARIKIKIFTGINTTKTAISAYMNLLCRMII